MGPPTNIQGYWINSYPSDLNSVDPNTLLSMGITDLFVYTSLKDPQNTLYPFILKFNDTDIRIHAWIVCFKAPNQWIIPNENPTYINALINNITYIATQYNISGINLDYVRYPGTAYLYPNATEHITSFVQQIYTNIQIMNNQKIKGKPQMLLSADLMADGSVNNYYYGQDYGKLSAYLDFLVPMIYKGNYQQDNTWIGTITKYIIRNANGRPVVTGLQTYNSDYDPRPLDGNELLADIKTAQGNGSSGFVLFRSGLISTNFPGVPLPSSYLTLSQISAGAKEVKAYYEKYKKLPSKVLINGNQVSMPQLLYILTRGVLQVNKTVDTPILLKNVNAAPNPSGSFRRGQILKSEYLIIANDLKTFMNLNGRAPNYKATSLGNMSFKYLVYMYSKLMSYYQSNNRLPHNVYMSP